MTPHPSRASWSSGSRNRGVDRMPGPRSQWLDMPLTHDQQVPHAGETTASTRSPGRTRRTSGPTSSTWPQASCPGTIGSGDRPAITVRSVWQIPLAEMRTSTSRAPIASCSRSSTTSGRAPGLRRPDRGEAMGSTPARSRQWVPDSELWPRPRRGRTHRLGSSSGRAQPDAPVSGTSSPRRRRSSARSCSGRRRRRATGPPPRSRRPCRRRGGACCGAARPGCARRRTCRR